MSYITRAQQAIYDTEELALTRFPPSRAARTRFELSPDSRSACEAYIYSVMMYPWFKDAFPVCKPLIVTTTRRGNRSYCSNGKIVLLEEQVCGGIAEAERTCLHELAHHVTTKPGDDKTHGHHHAWRVNYTLLVRNMIGWRAARYLRQGFAAVA
jgi:putative metallohydrolase (TIGR04338 family)